MMISATTAPVDHPSGHSIRFTRVVDAPIDLVWSIWTTEAHVRAWFGPEGFTLTTTRFDFRADGEWVFVMHSPDGRDIPNRIAFRELDAPRRLVYDNRWDIPGARLDFSASWNFITEGPRTRIEVLLTYEDADALNTAMVLYGVCEGGVTTMARVEEYLARMS